MSVLAAMKCTRSRLAAIIVLMALQPAAAHAHHPDLRGLLALLEAVHV